MKPPTAPEIDWSVQDQILTGEHPVCLDEDKVPCGVVCTNGLPQWLWVVDSLGFLPIWCLVHNASDVEWLRPTYPKIVFTTDPQYCTPVSALFCDGRPGPAVAFAWTQLQLVFYLKKGRIFPSWNHWYRTENHTAVGGCTDGEQTVHCLSRAGTDYQPQPSTAIVVPGCVYTSVASDTLDAGRSASAPPMT
jgi:hypothetical protein